MEELPLPYEERLLRELTDLLIELSLPGHLNPNNLELDESEEDDGPLQPWAGFIQDAAIRYQNSARCRDQFDNSETEKVRAELKSFRNLLGKIATSRALAAEGSGFQYDWSRPR